MNGANAPILTSASECGEWAGECTIHHSLCARLVPVRMKRRKRPAQINCYVVLWLYTCEFVTVFGMLGQHRRHIWRFETTHTATPSTAHRTHTHTHEHICAGGIWCARSARRWQQKKSHVNVVFEILRIWCFAGAVPNPFAFIHTWYTFTSVRNASHSCHNKITSILAPQPISAHSARSLVVDWCILYVTTCVWISCSQNETWCQYNTQQTTQYTLYSSVEHLIILYHAACPIFPFHIHPQTIWITVDTMCRCVYVCVCACARRRCRFED